MEESILCDKNCKLLQSSTARPRQGRNMLLLVATPTSCKQTELPAKFDRASRCDAPWVQTSPHCCQIPCLLQRSPQDWSDSRNSIDGLAVVVVWLTNLKQRSSEIRKNLVHEVKVWRVCQEYFVEKSALQIMPYR